MQEEINRLRWQCRRGMLELDLLLLSFFDKDYLDLSDTNKALFEQLLSYHDQDLYQWLIQRKPVVDPLLQRLVESIVRGH
ncbi:MAG: succinate dehydrogenase assembly factor 2 [Pseudomonadota bacterium]